jgi:hypothetical protein
VLDLCIAGREAGAARIENSAYRAVDNLDLQLGQGITRMGGGAIVKSLIEKTEPMEMLPISQLASDYVLDSATASLLVKLVFGRIWFWYFLGERSHLLLETHTQSLQTTVLR